MTAAATSSRAARRVADPDRWRDKHGLAEHFSCSIRWIEERMVEGMPHAYIAGRAKFKVAKAESWLDEHGSSSGAGVVQHERLVHRQRT